MRVIKPLAFVGCLLQGCVLGPEPTVNAPSFDQRCSLPSVVKCVGFDAASEITGTYGDNSGILPGATTPVLDTSFKASGASSLKFTIPSLSGSNTSGSYFTNFSDNLSVRFGENQEFYIQWRQRFSPEFLNTFYLGGGGWKQAIIGTGDKRGCNSRNTASGLCYASCTNLEIVVQNTDQRGYPQMYHSCGAKDGHYEGIGPVFPIGYRPDEWMTFQVYVKVGTWYKNDRNYRRDSTIELWVAREGYQSELAISRNNYDLASDDPTAGYGKIWLLPYHSRKSHEQSHPVAYTWYDDLIISTSRIPDP